MSMMRAVNRALEELDAEADAEKTIVMKGPLSEIYTKALNIYYAKPDPTTLEVTLESQEQDQAQAFQAMREMAQLLQTEQTVSDNPSATVTVYGVSRDAITEQDVVNITQDLANPVEDAGRYVLIVDGTQNGASDSDFVPQERVVVLESAINSMVLAHGGKIFTSLEDYARHR